MDMTSGPTGEAARVRALRALGVLDTPPEEVYDDVTALARQLCSVPVALVSLVDAERQWFKSARGTTLAETPRDQSFCTHAIEGDAAMEVEDALQDHRFADNPLVLQDPYIRFYAGTPIVTRGGHALGTVCVVDQQRRRLSDGQKAALAALARITGHLLEDRAAAAELSEVLDDLGMFRSLVPMCAWCGRIRDGKGRWHTLRDYVAMREMGPVSHGICEPCSAAAQAEQGR